MTIQIVPLPLAGEVEPGDDLPSLLNDAMTRAGLTLAGGDVVVVTQKIVSKAEGRIVPEGSGGRAAWVATETRRVVARRGDLVIAETRHGFVCANAGVDASNVAEGFLTLLPEDPDTSAEEIRQAFLAGLGAPVGVIVTDTFGRAWREGLVNVAIGCAGLPSLVDLRGTKDAAGRVLEATVEALAQGSIPSQRFLYSAVTPHPAGGVWSTPCPSSHRATAAAGASFARCAYAAIS